MTNLRPLACATLFTTLSVAATAQGKSQSQGHKAVATERMVTATFTIAAIDQAARAITLTSANGNEDTDTVSPRVTRFNQLKVGDKIRVTYREALLLELRKPGEATATTGEVVAGGQIKEAQGAAVGTRQTRTVTVKTIDVNAPSITVGTEDGRTMTWTVAEKRNLEGVNPGDQHRRTYTQAFVVKTTAAK
jgi:Cu/Ag efflux protein CusF